MEVEVNWLNPRISLHRPLLDNEAQRDDFEAMTATWVGEDTRVTWKYFIFLPISKQTSCPSTEWMYGLMLLCHSWVYMSGSSIARALNYLGKWGWEEGSRYNLEYCVKQPGDIYHSIPGCFSNRFLTVKIFDTFFSTGEFVIQNFESGLLKITDTSGPRNCPSRDSDCGDCNQVPCTTLFDHPGLFSLVKAKGGGIHFVYKTQRMIMPLWWSGSLGAILLKGVSFLYCSFYYLPFQ